MDRAEFERFFSATAPALKVYLRLRCSQSAVADDLLQETYLRLLRRPLPKLGGAQLKSYLYKTANTACADYYRARGREARWRREPPSGRADEFDDFESAVGNESATDAVALDLSDDTRRVFEGLKPRQQSLLWLAYVEGLTHIEIAEVMGVNVDSVKVLLHRARTELTAKLSEQGLAPVRASGAKR